MLAINKKNEQGKIKHHSLLPRLLSAAKPNPHTQEYKLQDEKRPRGLQEDTVTLRLRPTRIYQREQEKGKSVTHQMEELELKAT